MVAEGDSENSKECTEPALIKLKSKPGNAKIDTQVI